ncbi:hypothetical protein D9M68_277060 [compost metagenome]
MPVPDIRFIQKNLRHASIETTGIYLHAEEDRRHAHTVGSQHGVIVLVRRESRVVRCFTVEV